ncbi:ABC transporter ATP-binding protein [Candidatus Endowatersipora endosymbiont of Watersipora subatra]|uniref:ABC transporter ATP-binding protein n=1 Tax=Candidatus Endowatersipora endosymbiont of Watersipora subatra TaxID=3077946 RepID=UPI00312C7881
MIRIESVTKQFGGIFAVNNASMEIEKGSITALIGPNGAGKTTLFNIVAGHCLPTSGYIYLQGEDITGLPPYKLFAKGLLRTFQVAHEFSTLTLLENLMMVPSGQLGETLVNTWFRRSQVRVQEQEIEARARDVINFLNLDHLVNEKAGNLSGGQKKLLELGRTMMVKAKIVLLDEIGAGVNRTLLAKIGDLIMRLNQEYGYTFCMIEHDMDFISRLCNPVIVMADGAVLAQGSARDMTKNEDVIEAYLGKGPQKKKTE